MDLEFNYGLDSEYKFEYVKEMTESTPAGLDKDHPQGQDLSGYRHG